MNKILSSMTLAALALGFAACDEVEESLSQPATNPQEPIFEASNLVVTPIDGTLNLQSLAQLGEPAVVGTYTVSDFPASSSLQFQMQMSSDPEFATAATAQLEAKADSDNIVVDPTVLDDAYYKSITQNPEAATLYVRFIAEAVNGSEVARIGGPDAYFGTGSIGIRPFDPAEDSYYLVDVNNDATEAMSHSELAGWEDPVFSIIVEAPADGYAWAVESASTVLSGEGSHKGLVFYPEDPQAMSGKLVSVAVGEDYEPGQIPEGPYKLQVNMREMTYEISLAIKQLYTPGGSNGWNFDASQVLTTANYVKYTGYAHLSGEYKFTSQPDWAGINFGQGGEDGQLSTDGAAPNLKADDALYYCTVDVIALTYKNVAITSLGLIGDFNGWGGQEALTPSEDMLTWSGTVTMEAGQQFKFRANDDWGINLGGELDNLYQDGANLVAPSSGTYTVSLNLSAVPYTATMELQ